MLATHPHLSGVSGGDGEYKFVENNFLCLHYQGAFLFLLSSCFMLGFNLNFFSFLDIKKRRKKVICLGNIFEF